ncbi:Conserved hypothetical secreted protein [Candidatus Protochlamydia naegleriophila]|uniref:Conserved hypothetical secreted protein n=1 Tax=Candidatus Protochlamydia naegleriophila TaxID=389348 RepID=A0A0U5K5N3_9BACT|nr:BON domain-containing protein [Candidatus Protochlamydia naegleriophila]CUI17435.1 Conserved hypothetical secreted protein [Candidatus Protochlamydia naegleriophila]
MKKIFSLIALGSVALVSADQYYQPYGNGAQSSQGYYQRDNQGYQRNNQYDYQQAPRNQSYDQNQQYYQQSSQSYNRDQQKNYSQRDNNQGGVSDQEINRKLQDKLGSGWFSKGYQNVSFDVHNGIVNLRGSVDTLENKNNVEDSVRKIDGVRQVNNQITIVKENSDTYSDSELQDSEKKYPRDSASNFQDRQLNAKIRDKLSNGWFSKDYETLVIRTTNGVVVISGTVDKQEDVQKINDQLKEIEGIRSINNQLRVNNR